MKTGPKPRSIEERFDELIQVDPISGCWLWLGHIHSAGYGLISIRLAPNTYKALYAHRFSYERFVGQIPEDLQIDHLCRVRCCVNPAHLEPVTVRENLLRGFGASGVNARKTHCVRGHPLEGSNLVTTKVGGRKCRTCKLAAERELYARQTKFRRAAKRAAKK